MGRINNTPEGLLDLVGNKVGGRPPTQLSDTGVATVQLNGLLRSRRIATAVANALTAAIGDSAEIRVPDGEVWEIFAVDSMVSADSVGDQCRVRIQLEDLANSEDPQEIIIINEGTLDAALNGGALIVSTCYFSEPIVVPAGTLIKAVVADTSDGTLLWSFHVGHYKLVQ